MGKLGVLLVSAVFGVVLSAAACEEQASWNVVNETSATLTVEVGSRDGSFHPVNEVAPGRRLSVYTGFTGCKDARYRAADAEGSVVAEVSRVCMSETWTIAATP